MKLNPKALLSKLPLPFWVSFYLLLIILTIPVLAYIGTLSKADPGTLTVTINQKTGTTDPNPSYTSVFTVVFSEAIDSSTFTNTDITLGGTAPGQTIQSITEAGSFNKTTYEVRIQATSAGTITPTIAQELITAQSNNTNTNQASTSSDNTVTYDGTWAPNEFVMTVKTDNPGYTNSNQIRIPTYGSGYNYNVDWGDSTTSSNQTGDSTHTYSSPGTYTVKIAGTFPRISFGDGNGGDTDHEKIQTIKQWGTNPWTSMEGAFQSTSSLTINTVDAPNLANLTNMSRIFNGSASLNNNINFWNVSNVTNMSFAFNSTSTFNQPLNNWNVSNVTNMRNMFSGASTFNQPLNNWNVSNLTNMSAMFLGASTFNQPLNNWNVSNVTNMSAMFSGASTFNQPLNNWNVSNVTNMSAMFSGSAPVTTQSYYTNSTFFNQPLNNWNVSNVTNMREMFTGASSFDQPLNSWNVSNVTDMVMMFAGASSFDQSLSSWDMTSVSSTPYGGLSGIFDAQTAISRMLMGMPYNNWPSIMQQAYTNLTLSGLSVTNYDSTLASWSSQSLQSGVTFDAGTSKYCLATVDRQNIITNHSWTINDGGKDCLSLQIPVVSNQSASNITQNSVDITATITPPGITSRGVQYGLSNSYGNTQNDSNTYSQSYSYDKQWGPTSGGVLSSGMTTDQNDNIYVIWDNAKVQKYDKNGTYISQFGSGGSGNGQFDMPRGIAIDNNGFIYVADTFNHRIQKFTNSGTYITQWGTYGTGNGQFDQPFGLAVDSSNRIFVSDINNNRIQVFNSSGVYQYQFGGYGSGDGQIHGPNNMYVAYDPNAGQEYLYVADTGNHRIQKLTLNGTFVSKFGSGGSGDGQFLYPRGIKVDSNQDIYVVDYANHRVQKLTNNGTYITKFGSGGSGNGQFSWPHDLVLTNDGEIVVSDSWNHRVQKFKGSTSTAVSLSGLNCGTTYHYRAFATNGAGTGYGSDQTFTTDNCPVDPATFITTWKTDNPGVSGNNQITIPTFSGETYNYNVDWGDSSTSSNQTGDTTHTYSSPGTYTVKITGTFPRIYFSGVADHNKILTIEQWGTNPWTSMASAFSETANLTIPATDAPNLSNVTDMSYMFSFATSLNSNINNWDVSNVTDMSSMFYNATSFNQPLNNWNVSNVTNMRFMFYNATSFNQPLGNWNTSNVTGMYGMFRYATSFNSDINNWDVSNVVDMSSVFANATSFNQSLNSWNVSNVTDMSGLFYNATSFNGNISSWNTSNVTDMSFMFDGATNFNQPLNAWDVSSVIDMRHMFASAVSFNQPLNNWNTSAVEDMGALFFGAYSFNQSLNTWNVENVIEMDGMFAVATSFNQPLNNWNVSNVTNMETMFSSALSFNQSLASWNVSDVVSMNNMFGDFVSYYKTLAETYFYGPYNTWDQSTKDQFWSSMSGLFGYPINEFNIPNSSGLSTANYDATLASWSLQNLEGWVTFGAGTSKYCNSETQRQSIIDTKFWTINDGGKDCPPPPPPQLSVPSAPQSLSITNKTTTSLQFNWAPPASDGGSPITGYQVQYKLASSNDWINAPLQDASKTSHVFTNLSPKTSYHFRVSAINAIGQGPYSAHVSGTTEEPILVVDPPFNPDPETPTTNTETNEPEPDTPVFVPDTAQNTNQGSNTVSRPRNNKERPLSLARIKSVMGSLSNNLVNYSERLPKPVAQAIPYSLLALLLALSALYGYSSYLENKRRQALQALITRFKSLLSARATFLRITSHYINTPITKIQGTIELLAMGTTTTTTANTNNTTTANTNNTTTANTNNPTNNNPSTNTTTSSNTSSPNSTSIPINTGSSSQASTASLNNSSSQASSTSSTPPSNTNSSISSSSNPPTNTSSTTTSTLATTATTLTIPEASIVACSSAIKSLTNHANELLDEGQSLTGRQQANISNLEKQKGLSILTHPFFWLPIVVISTIVVLLNVIFVQAHRYTPTAITIASQLLLGFVGVIALGVSYYFYRSFQSQRQILATEQEIEQEFNARQANFIADAYNKLNDDIMILEGISKDLAKYPKARNFHQGLNDLKEIVSQLEKLSSLSKHVPGIQYHTNLSSTISTTLTNLRPLADQQNITITTNNIQANQNVNIEANALTHLLLAPLKNAISASTAGSKIELSQTNNRTNHKAIQATKPNTVTTNPNNTNLPIQITITDHGKGIPPEQLNNIFTPFNSAHSLEHFTDTGLGLDLYLCKVITEQYNANLTITSQPEEGTTVVVGLG